MSYADHVFKHDTTTTKIYVCRCGASLSEHTWMSKTQFLNNVTYEMFDLLKAAYVAVTPGSELERRIKAIVDVVESPNL